MSRTPKLTIIIPVRNEEQTIAGVLRSLSKQDNISDCQVLVIDGQSVDGTADLASAFPFVEVLQAEPGLESQMNAGAREADAGALWFLHSDMTLPSPATVNHVLYALDNADVIGGACRFHLRGHDLYFSVVNVLVNLRARVLGRPYGDQAIFVRKSAFQEVGGFVAGACSDIDLVLRLRELGRFVLIQPKAETSARTWRRYGKVRTTAWHLREWIGYEWRRRRRSDADNPPGSMRRLEQPKNLRARESGSNAEGATSQ